jgi:hypothetical protein
LAAVDLAVHNGTNHIYNQKHAHIAARVAEVAHKATAQKHNKVPARKSRGDRERKQKLICLTEDETRRKAVGDRRVAPTGGRAAYARRAPAARRSALHHHLSRRKLPAGPPQADELHIGGKLPRLVALVCSTIRRGGRHRRG